MAQAPAEASEPTEKPAQPDALQELLTIERLSAKDEQITTLVNRHIDQVVESTKVRERFNLAILFDGSSINRSDADRIWALLIECCAACALIRPPEPLNGITWG